MPKRKASAQLHVADGAGGMRRVADHRFDVGEWPMEFAVAAEEAEDWMAQLDAEIEERGWSASAFSQLDAAENSGTLSVHAASGQSPPTLVVVWEKSRYGRLQLRARPTGDPEMSLQLAQEFVEAVAQRHQERRMLRAHRREALGYEGLAWRGELWLDADHRLGPPSKFPDALLGPQTVIVDAMIEGIGQKGVTTNHQSHVRELCVFLGFVLGIQTSPVRWKEAWVCDFDDSGRLNDCVLRTVGYGEIAPPGGYPVPGGAPQIDRRDAKRPDLGPLGIWADMHQQWVPDDIEHLWALFAGLPAARKDQLMRAGNAHLVAKSMWPEQRTAYATYLVVSCEALRPAGRRFRNWKMYDVVADLAGEDEAKLLREASDPPHRVRNRHVHRGELSSSELLPMVMHDYFLETASDARPFAERLEEGRTHMRGIRSRRDQLRFGIDHP